MLGVTPNREEIVMRTIETSERTEAVVRLPAAMASDWPGRCGADVAAIVRVLEEGGWPSVTVHRDESGQPVLAARRIGCCKEEHLVMHDVLFAPRIRVIHVPLAQGATP